MADNFSSSEENSYEKVVYTPTLLDENDELECNDDAYNILEYYASEWPSQTVASYGTDFVVIGTNPENSTPKIELLDMKNLCSTSFVSASISTPCAYNRIRTNCNINCVSTDKLDVYNSMLENVCSLSWNNNLGYGLCADTHKVFFSDVSGNVIVFTDQVVNQLSLHDGSIESLCIDNHMLFSSSTDRTMKITDLRTKEVVLIKKGKCDINAVDYNKDNMVAYGDDDGIIHVVDIRNPDIHSSISWHKSSVSSLKWKDVDIFCSSSDEQVCVFDMSLEDDWEYEKYLLFVHQGQKYYKDVCYSPVDIDIVVTTSLDGLCFFKPISFTTE